MGSSTGGERSSSLRAKVCRLSERRAEFKLGLDRVGAVTGEIADGSKRSFETLCEWARADSDVAGFVKKIYVDVGDRVKEGQLLTVLEIPEMQDELTRALAAKRRSSADLERARDELLRHIERLGRVTRRLAGRRPEVLSTAR